MLLLCWKEPMKISDILQCSITIESLRVMMIAIQSPLRLIALQYPNICSLSHYSLNNLELICIWIYTFSLSPNPYVVSVGKEPILAMFHFSPMDYNVIIWTQKILWSDWSHELHLNWSMARIGLRPGEKSFINFQFCDQLYVIWFQMSCEFSIFKPWQWDIKHEKD